MNVLNQHDNVLGHACGTALPAITHNIANRRLCEV